MNQSIGCGPMPFALPSDKAAAENATLLSGSKISSTESEASFSEVLDSEIEDEAKPDKEQNELEAWALFGALPVAAQLPPVSIVLSISSTEAVEDLSQPDEPTVLDQGEVLSTNISPEAGTELAKEAEIERSEAALKLRLETLKLAEQKVPSPASAEFKEREEIAENPAKPAKITYGMVAAQGALMVSESQKQEETALEQNLSLSAEVFADTEVEPLGPSKPLLAAKNASSDTKFNYADFAPIEGLKSEWSSFEGISESSDLQPVKANEAVEIAQAIRSHVQVLKGSNQEKIEVVLRPDGQTELRLHVEKVNGQILVQARCDRGDFARLESNWTAVQQTLANQGVRVESLVLGNFSQNHDNFQNPSRTFDERPTTPHPQDTNFIEQKVRPSKNQPPVSSRAPVQGWQSWA